MSDSGTGTTLPAPRPATRIGRTVIFPGGAVIQLSRTTRVLFALGLRTSLSTPHQRKENAQMAFWDSHEVKSGGGYLTPDEKDALMESGQSFDIKGIKHEKEGKYGPRYVLTLDLPDPATGENETRMIGFPIDSGVTSRDDILKAMLEDHFAAGETEPIPAILSKGGNAILLLPAP